MPRESIVAYVAEDGVRCSRDEVLITNGAKHATELAVMVFTTAIASCDRTNLHDDLQCFRNHGVSLLAIPTTKAWTQAFCALVWKRWSSMASRCPSCYLMCRISTILQDSL